MAITQKSLLVNLLIAFAAIAVAIPFLWLFRGFAWWIVLSFLIYWSLAAALVAFAWKKWAAQARPQMNAEGISNDRPFLIGQILGTLSCCAPLFFFVPLTGSWELVRVFGVIFSLVAAVSALFLPFGRQRAKRLTILGCVMNVAFYGFCAIYALSVAGDWLLD